ncbi:hypothetical protein EDB84DRAFT_1571646 [Lactarius hengduanensis]|nr:hypothetical protein EDB84DRAFT_1571646 [Lactarius hengduanensis]
MYPQLKQEYDTVKELRKLSGFGWDPTKKSVTASLDVWSEYCKKHPKAGPFRKKGFPLFNKIGDLIDSSRTTGEFVFRGDNDNFAINPNLLDISCDMNSSRDRNNSWDDEGASENETPAEINTPGPSKAASKRLLFDPGPANESIEVPGEDNDNAKATAQAKKRKHAKSTGASLTQATTGSERHNVRHVSAGEGMNSVAGSVTSAAGTLADALAKAVSSIQPPVGNLIQPANVIPNESLSFAVALMEVNEGFLDDDIATAAECMATDPNVTTTYVSLTSHTVHSKFIRSTMDKFHEREGAGKRSPSP